MLDTLINEITCDVCGDSIVFDKLATVAAYKETVDLNITDVLGSLDKIMEEYLVYTCTTCGTKYRYNYRTVEKILRRQLLEKLLLNDAKNYLSKSPLQLEKYLIYCGKCPGIDGSGRCTEAVFDKCKIKRFPINEL